MLGEVLASYRITGKLGEGGMGVVYRAEHTLLGKKVAIKLLLPEFSRDPELVNRFFNEAKSTTLIEHPGIVDVFDFGFHAGGSAYIVMELVNGESLANHLRRGRMALEPILAITRQVASAVGAAHAKGIVHRDLKPDNVLLVADADAPAGVRTKVLDFGIAKLAEEAKAGGMKTRTGSVMGTPAYMSPEQCRGAGRVDHRADIYSLGCMLFEMACGHRPFEREGTGEILGGHMYEAPPAPRQIDPSVHPGTEALILRMLAKRPEDRPQSMDEVRAEIDRLGFRRHTAPPIETLIASPDDPRVPGMPTPAHLSQPPPPAVTTLGHSASAVGTRTAPPQRAKTALFVGGAAAIVTILVAVVVLGAGGGGGKKSQPAATPTPAAAPAPSEPVPAAQPEPAPAKAAPAPTAKPTAPEGLLLVEAGTLHAGRPAYRSAPSLDVPPHDVAIAAFAIAPREVTNAEYKAFVDAGTAPAPWPASAPFDLLGPLPVVKVAFADAEAFCRWRYPGGRLPTEFEWEWAGRGPAGRLYPWGNAYFRECANGLAGEDGVLEAVGSRACGATSTGLADLSGNVWEWTSSPATAYPGSTLTTPGQDFHIVRGGSFYNTSRDDLTLTARQFVKEPNPYLGFRCAADLAGGP